VQRGGQPGAQRAHGPQLLELAETRQGLNEARDGKKGGAAVPGGRCCGHEGPRRSQIAGVEAVVGGSDGEQLDGALVVQVFGESPGLIGQAEHIDAFPHDGGDGDGSDGGRPVGPAWSAGDEPVAGPVQVGPPSQPEEGRRGGTENTVGQVRIVDHGPIEHGEHVGEHPRHGSSVVVQRERCGAVGPVVGVAPLGGVQLAGVAQAFETELAQRLQHPVGAGGVVVVDETLVDEPGEAGGDIAGSDVSAIGGDGFGGVEIEPSRTHGQPAQDHPVHRIKKVLAPVDRGQQGLVARQGRPRAAAEQTEGIVQASGDPFEWQGPGAGGGQFEGQGDAVEPGADCNDGRRGPIVDDEVGAGFAGPFNE
jgi:hypothetical protein